MKNERLNVRCTKGLKELFQLQAIDNDESLSSYILLAAMDKLSSERKKHASIVYTKTPSCHGKTCQ